MKTAIHQSWQRLRDRAAAVRLPGRRALSRSVGFLRDGIANLVFPPSCLCCDEELEEFDVTSEIWLCSACLEQMDLFDGPACGLCGAPLPPALVPDGDVHSPFTVRTKGASRGCYRCRGRKLWFDHTIALGMYDGKLRECLLRMKKVEGDGLSLALGRLLAQVQSEQLAALEADVVVPIPLYWRRRVEHKTNSAALLAEVLSAKLRLPRADRLLKRTRSTRRQNDVSHSERWGNVRRAFTVRAGYHLRDAHVLLVDDILTTGATCSEAARALREAGAARVTIAVVARAFGK